uniref:DDE_3 domain-containing protein n=1 Tax=Strongyloides stercoralis TaxID=6248 RepID=A0A0K0ETC2_STRER
MLNPIENAFSKIKNGIRSKLQLEATGVLSEMMMKDVNNITEVDAAGYFRHVLRNITNCAAEMLHPLINEF